MAIQTIVTATDQGADLLSAFNNNANEQFQSASSNGTNLTITKHSGSIITVPLNVSGGSTLFSAGTGSNSIKSNIGTNTAAGGYSFVTGKINAVNSGAVGACIVGGQNNTVYTSGGLSFIAAGIGNRTKGLYSFIGAGSSNYIAASSNYSCILGFNHEAAGTAVAILGGYSSKIKASANASVIVGGINNQVNTSVARAVVIGGHHISATTNDNVYVPQLSIWNGGGLNYYTGSTQTAAAFGKATLIAGTVTINTTAVKSNSHIHLTQKAGGTPSTIWYDNIINNTSFVISGSSSSNTSEVAWMIVNQF